MRRLLFVLAALPVGGASGSDAPLTDNEVIVWKLEESYYQHAMANDQEAYLELFHDDAIGWPTLDIAPKGKDQVHKWISDIHGNPGEVWGYELDLQAIQDFGEVVVVHYLLRDYFRSTESGDEIRSDLFRISHTWHRTGDTWKIISGMGGRLNR